MIARWDPNTGRTQNLRQHLEAVAARTAAWSGKLKGGHSQDIGFLIGLLHDFGKAYDRWQAYIRRIVQGEAGGKKLDHSTASGKVIRRLLQEVVPPGWENHGQMVLEISSLATFGHHGGLMDLLTTTGSRPWKERLSKPIADESSLPLLQQKLFPEKDWEDLSRRAFQSAVKTIGVFSSTDNTWDYFDYGMWAKFLLSALIDADRLNAFEFDIDQTVGEHRYDFQNAQVRFESRVAKFTADTPVNQARRRISEACLRSGKRPLGMYQLTCPTGGGKTLASLRFALEHMHTHAQLERIIVVMPYLSIIEQNAREARKFLGDDQAVLEYHSNLIPREEKKSMEEEQQAKIEDVLAERWDAPVIFTSMVQFLNTFYTSSTRDKRRLHNLANSVIVLDEVQSVPLHCSELLLRSVDWLAKHANSTVVLMTATQPRVHNLAGSSLERFRQGLPEIVALTSEDKSAFERVRFRYDKHRIWKSAKEAAAFLQEQMQSTESLLMVCNTKTTARSIYEELRGEAEYETVLLSTDLCPEHRKDRIAYLRKRLSDSAEKPILCVSTQLIEAGVDISFGHVVRALAGLDSVLQAAGRCNRHGEKAIGIVDIVEFDSGFEVLKNLPDILDAKIAAKSVLHGIDTDDGMIRLEDPIVSLYFDTFFESVKEKLSYPMETRGRKRARTMIDALGGNSTLDQFESDEMQLSRQSFAEAEREFKVISQEGTAVIVPYRSNHIDNKCIKLKEEGKKTGDEKEPQRMTAQEVIAVLVSDDDMEAKKRALRFAQSYTIQLFDYQFQKLQADGALFPTTIEGVWYLGEQWYGEDGLDMEGTQPLSLPDF